MPNRTTSPAAGRDRIRSPSSRDDSVVLRRQPSRQTRVVTRVHRLLRATLLRTSVTASVLSAALITGACGSRWPNQVATVTSADLGGRPVRTIDLLPVDLEVWSHPDVLGDADQIRLGAEARLVGAASETFYRRGYQVGAVLDWDGRYVGPDGTPQVALPQPMLFATVDSLASYGTFVGNSRSLPDPILPSRLGASGSDATLYIGGWGFVGKAPERGQLAGKIILGTILVVGLIVIVAALAKSKSDPLGKIAGGTARGVARAGASMGRAALRAGSAIVDISRAGLQGIEPVLEPAIEVAVSAPPPISIPQRPVWSNDKTLPRTGRSRMYLEMTLVDNRSGRVLWHAHQAFPADPERPGDVMKAAKQLLGSLPPA